MVSLFFYYINVFLAHNLYISWNIICRVLFKLVKFLMNFRKFSLYLYSVDFQLIEHFPFIISIKIKAIKESFYDNLKKNYYLLFFLYHAKKLHVIGQNICYFYEENWKVYIEVLFLFYVIFNTSINYGFVLQYSEQRNK